jgi:predicted RNA-binding protein
MAFYNVYIEHSPERKQYIIVLNDEQINKLVEAYLNGEKSILIKGVERNVNRPEKFIIYSINDLYGMNGSQANAEQNLRKYARMDGGKFSQRFFTRYGSNITDSLTHGQGWGSRSKPTHPPHQVANTINYVSPTRISDLKLIKKSSFDLSKLIRLAEELNTCFSNECYFACGALVRSILDHVPPIFGKKNFDEVTNNYSPPGRSKSFKESMEHLNKSMRKISDKIVHSQITASETLPNEMQVDCKRDLDVLLEEIVRVLKV